MFKDFKIILPLEVREKIQYFVDEADKEISGLGDAWIDLENKTVTVKSAFLLDQECSATTTDIDEDAVSKAMFQAHRDEQAGTPRSIKFWWHSHVNMNVFWSGTDVTTMKELSEHGWFAHIVFNKKREMLGAISYPYVMEAVGVRSEGVHYTSEIDIEIPGLFTEDELTGFKAEMTAKYKEKTYPAYPSTYTNYGRGGQQTNFEDYEDYFEDNYGPGYSRVGLKEGYEVGDFLPDGSKCLFWTEFLKVVSFEGDEINPDDVWFKSFMSDGWVSIEEHADDLNIYQYEKLSLDAIDSIYMQLEKLTVPPKIFEQLGKLYEDLMAEAVESNRNKTLLLNGGKGGDYKPNTTA